MADMCALKFNCMLHIYGLIWKWENTHYCCNSAVWDYYAYKSHRVHHTSHGYRLFQKGVGLYNIISVCQRTEKE